DSLKTGMTRSTLSLDLRFGDIVGILPCASHSDLAPDSKKSSGFSLELKAQDRVQHLLLIARGQPIVERQTHKLIGYFFSDRAIANLAAERMSHVGEMQRQIMKDTVNATLAQIHDEFLAQIEVRHEQVEHVIGLFTMLRYDGQTHIVRIRPIFQPGVVHLPHALAVGLYLFTLFKL